MHAPTNIDLLSTLRSCFGADLGSSTLPKEIVPDLPWISDSRPQKILFGKIGVTLLSVLSAFLTARHVLIDFRENPAYFEDFTFLEFLSRIWHLMLFYE
jgi:hypothetical protein